MLSSWWAGLMVVSMAVCFARTAREDEYLRAHLAGYADYAERVRWRLVPRIW